MKKKQLKRKQFKRIVACVLVFSILVTYFSIIVYALSSDIKKEKEVIYLDCDYNKTCNNVVEIEFLEKEQTISDEIVKTNDELAFEELSEVIECIDWIDKYYEVHEKYNLTATLLEDEFTEVELMYIYRTVETETYQADFLSKVHVANVVFNRLNSGYNNVFGNSIKDIITKPNQFDYHRTTISEDTIKAVRYAYTIGDLTNGALFFDNNMSLCKKYDIVYIFTDICGHNFFKFKE